MTVEDPNIQNIQYGKFMTTIANGFGIGLVIGMILLAGVGTAGAQSVTQNDTNLIENTEPEVVQSAYVGGTRPVTLNHSGGEYMVASLNRVMFDNSSDWASTIYGMATYDVDDIDGMITNATPKDAKYVPDGSFEYRGNYKTIGKIKDQATGEEFLVVRPENYPNEIFYIDPLTYERVSVINFEDNFSFGNSESPLRNVAFDSSGRMYVSTPSDQVDGQFNIIKLDLSNGGTDITTASIFVNDQEDFDRPVSTDVSPNGEWYVANFPAVDGLYKVNLVEDNVTYINQDGSDDATIDNDGNVYVSRATATDQPNGIDFVFGVSANGSQPGADIGDIYLNTTHPDETEQISVEAYDGFVFVEVLETTENTGEYTSNSYIIDTESSNIVQSSSETYTSPQLNSLSNYGTARIVPSGATYSGGYWTGSQSMMYVGATTLDVPESGSTPPPLPPGLWVVYMIAFSAVAILVDYFKLSGEAPDEFIVVATTLSLIGFFYFYGTDIPLRLYAFAVASAILALIIVRGGSGGMGGGERRQPESPNDPI